MEIDLNNFSEKIGKSLDSEMCQRFHIILWEKAAAAYEVGNYNFCTINNKTITYTATILEGDVIINN